MRLTFRHLNEKEFDDCIKRDGELITRGYGVNDINIFTRYKNKGGGHLSYGDGVLGNILAKYGRRILPLLQKYIFPAAKDLGKNVAKDMLHGDISLRQSLKKRGKQSLKQVGEHILSGRGRRMKGSVKRMRKGVRKRGRTSLSGKRYKNVVATGSSKKRRRRKMTSRKGSGRIIGSRKTLKHTKKRKNTGGRRRPPPKSFRRKSNCTTTARNGSTHIKDIFS